MQNASSIFLSEAWYHSVPAQTGDLLLFYQDVPHFGTQNNSDQRRMVAFDLLSDMSYRDNPDQDLHQIFPWVIAQTASEPGKLGKFIGALLDNQQYQPMAHYERPAQLRAREEIKKAMRTLNEYAVAPLTRFANLTEADGSSTSGEEDDEEESDGEEEDALGVAAGNDAAKAKGDENKAQAMETD